MPTSTRQVWGTKGYRIGIGSLLLGGVVVKRDPQDGQPIYDDAEDGEDLGAYRPVKAEPNTLGALGMMLSGTDVIDPLDWPTNTSEVTGKQFVGALRALTSTVSSREYAGVALVTPQMTVRVLGREYAVFAYGRIIRDNATWKCYFLPRNAMIREFVEQNSALPVKWQTSTRLNLKIL